jgi:hypothetical protein
MITMKTTGPEYAPDHSGCLKALPLTGLLLCTASGLPAVAAGANDEFQYNTLLNPIRAQLNAEARGRVMIYDGLEEAVVDRALDEQFDRIEHMMFTRTRQTPADDEDIAVVEDDGC